MSEHTGPWPHPGGCSGCRDLRLCNVCARPLQRFERCTNGRCRDCHGDVCTPGGDTGPGHGYGTREAAERAAARRRI